ncbi:MAG: hypothetical protein ACU85U_06285 [Gammaproteobacteria bacterium]
MSAPNYTIIDKVGMPHVIDFVQRQMRGWDTRPLDWLKLLPLNRNVLLHGECTFPGETAARGQAHGYRIRVSVNVIMPPPYRFEHYGRVPSARHPRGWVSGEQTFFYDDLAECAVHTLGHECFHYLSDTGQVELENSEANANWWADHWLDAYRSLVEPGGQMRLFC